MTAVPGGCKDAWVRIEDRGHWLCGEGQLKVTKFGVVIIAVHNEWATEYDSYSEL